MKLLMIGVGYVGMELLKQLQTMKEAIHVTTTDASKKAFLQSYANKVTVLLPEDAFQMRDLIKDCDVLIVTIAPKNGETYENTYLKMAKKIIAASKERTAPLYILYTSSTSVYEGITEEWGTEDLHLKPPSENGKILLETENWYLKHHDTCILRLGGIFGPGRELENRAKKLSGKSFPGSGDEPTNHIHLNDIVSAIIYCFERRITGVYNLVNHEHPTRKELYGRLCKELSIPEPVWGESPSHPKRGYKISNNKIIEAGLLFFHTLT